MTGERGERRKRRGHINARTPRSKNLFLSSKLPADFFFPRLHENADDYQRAQTTQTIRSAYPLNFWAAHLLPVGRWILRMPPNGSRV